MQAKLKFFKDSHLKTGFELETSLNPIYVDDFKGKELVLEIRSPNIDNEDTFYTDSNGLWLEKRVKDHRWSFSAPELKTPSSNYYPVNPLISIVSSTGLRMRLNLY